MRDKEVIKAYLQANMGSEREQIIFAQLGFREEDINEEQLELIDVLEQFGKSNELDELLNLDKEILEDEMQFKSPIHGFNHTRRVAFLLEF